MSQNRLYTEKEFGNVLRRATELQQEEGASAAPGLTLNELQHVAKEAGIDPDFVRRAAAELDLEPPEKGDLLFGGPTRLEFKSVVDRKVSGPEWDGAVEVIRHVIGVDGREVLDGPSREWVHQDQMGGRMRVSMTPTDQQTRIHASYRMTEWLWLHFIMVCVGIAPVALQYALLDLGAVTETGIALFTFLAFYMIGWVVFRIFSTRQERKMRGLIARLHKLLTRTREEESRPIQSLSEEHAIDVDASVASALSETPDRTAPSHRVKTRSR